MASMSPQQAEYNLTRKYLEWIADLPWSERAEISEDLEEVEEQLN